MKLLHRRTSMTAWGECHFATAMGWYLPQLAHIDHKLSTELDPGWNPEDRSPWLTFKPFRRGSAGHHGMQRVFRAALDDDAINIGTTAVEACKGLSVLEQAEVYELLIRFQENLLDDPVNPAWVAAVEETFKVELPGGRRFQWTVDVMEVNTDKHHPMRGAIITDWKTNWRVQSQSDFEADAQVRWYAAATLLRFPKIPRVTFRKRFMRYPNVVRSVTYERGWEVAVLQEMSDRCRVIDDAVEQSILYPRQAKLQPTGGEWCAKCDQRPRCPLLEEWRERQPEDVVLPPESPQQAALLLSEQKALEWAAKARAELIKNYAETHEDQAIEVGEGFYSFKTKRQRSVLYLTDVEGTFQRDNIDLAPFHGFFKLDRQEFDRKRETLPTEGVAVIDLLTSDTTSTEWRYTAGPAPVADVDAVLPPEAPPEDVDEKPDPEAIDLMEALKDSVEQGEATVTALPYDNEIGVEQPEEGRCPKCGKPLGPDDLCDGCDDEPPDDSQLGYTTGDPQVMFPAPALVQDPIPNAGETQESGEWRLSNGQVCHGSKIYAEGAQDILNRREGQGNISFPAPVLVQDTIPNADEPDLAKLHEMVQPLTRPGLNVEQVEALTDEQRVEIWKWAQAWWKAVDADLLFQEETPKCILDWAAEQPAEWVAGVDLPKSANPRIARGWPVNEGFGKWELSNGDRFKGNEVGAIAAQDAVDQGEGI